MGKVMISGVAPQMKAPSTEILASDIAVGSSVYLMENGVATEYLVVNQGKPSGSSLYDDSCDGMWLLRKDCVNSIIFDHLNDYANSDLKDYLNGQFFQKFDSIAKSIIKQVKIPYRAGSGYGNTVSSGANGHETKVFLLSATELNWGSSVNSCVDGASLEYFSNCAETDDKRISNYNGSAYVYWTRSPYCNSNYENKGIVSVTNGGGWVVDNCAIQTRGVRPALILPSTALFDKNTLVLKGVS